MTDMKGRVCIVTGANTGIGEVTARELARMGAHVLLACRSEDKTAPVVAAIRKQTGNDAVEFVPLDLGSLASVRRCVEAFLARDLPLHVLVNNAGLGGQRGVTEDGFELHFGVNHLGHFLLTVLLRDRLVRSAPARVVHVASKAHFQASGIDFERVRGGTRSLTGMPEYAVSKLANVLFSAELSKRLEGTRVSSYSLHPGVVASDIWRRIPFFVRPLVTAFMISTEEGARTSLHCATAPDAQEQTGLYWDRCEPRNPSKPARDAALAAELWARSEAFVA
jgi:NAD(P)-dependent dehydrogenase (short-subunit alcohol dehydrogenase family)